MASWATNGCLAADEILRQTLKTEKEMHDVAWRVAGGIGPLG